MLQKCSLWKVARVFFDEPTKQHTLKGVSIRSGLAHTSVKKHLKTLESEDVIYPGMDYSRRTYFISSLKVTGKYKMYKQLDILERLHISGVMALLEKEFAPTAIILFGSASRGEDIEESDVDLFVQTSESKQPDLRKFEHKLNRKIQLHLKKNIREYPKELQNNIVNGITLYGFVEAVK